MGRATTADCAAGASCRWRNIRCGVSTINGWSFRHSIKGGRIRFWSRLAQARPGITTISFAPFPGQRCSGRRLNKNGRASPVSSLPGCVVRRASRLLRMIKGESRYVCGRRQPATAKHLPTSGCRSCCRLRTPGSIRPACPWRVATGWSVSSTATPTAQSFARASDNTPRFQQFASKSRAAIPACYSIGWSIAPTSSHKKSGFANDGCKLRRKPACRRCSRRRGKGFRYPEV